MQYYSLGRILALLQPREDFGFHECKIDLKHGDSAWNPADPYHSIVGPGKYLYRRYMDGRWETQFFGV